MPMHPLHKHKFVFGFDSCIYIYIIIGGLDNFFKRTNDNVKKIKNIETK